MFPGIGAHGMSVLFLLSVLVIHSFDSMGNALDNLRMRFDHSVRNNRDRLLQVLTRRYGCTSRYE